MLYGMLWERAEHPAKLHLHPIKSIARSEVQIMETVNYF